MTNFRCAAQYRSVNDGAYVEVLRAFFLDAFRMTSRSGLGVYCPMD